MPNNKIKCCTITQQNMTAEHAFHVSLSYKFLTGICTMQKRLNLFGMTRGEAEGSPETSITDEAFTAVVMTIVMGERSSPSPLRRLTDIQSHST